MPDVRLVENDRFPALAVTLDWLLLPSGELDSSRALATAVIVALGTDRLANADDLLPWPDDTDRMGWWGDFDAAEVWNGWPIGTRLWLLKRDKITDAGAKQGATVGRVLAYLKECLQPFVDARIITDFHCDAARNPYRRNRIDASVTLYRGPSPQIDLQFQILWDELVTIGPR